LHLEQSNPQKAIIFVPSLCVWLILS